MKKLKLGDNVVVIAGKDNGVRSTVVAVNQDARKVVVKGVNIVTKHKKARKQGEKSEIIKIESPIDASNVMVICPTCGQPTRVGIKEVEGKRARYCKKCEAVIADIKKEKASKKAAKKAPKAKKAVKEEVNEVVAEEKPVKKTAAKKAPAKKTVKEEKVEVAVEEKPKRTRKATAAKKETELASTAAEEVAPKAKTTRKTAPKG